MMTIQPVFPPLAHLTYMCASIPPLMSQYWNNLNMEPVGLRSTKPVHVFVTLTSSNWLQLLGGSPLTGGQRGSSEVEFPFASVERVVPSAGAFQRGWRLVTVSRAERSWITALNSVLDPSVFKIDCPAGWR